MPDVIKIVLGGIAAVVLALALFYVMIVCLTVTMHWAFKTVEWIGI